MLFKCTDAVDMPRMLCFDALRVHCQDLDRRRSLLLLCVLCVACMVTCGLCRCRHLFFSFLCLSTRQPNVWGMCDFILSCPARTRKVGCEHHCRHRRLPYGCIPRDAADMPEM